MTTILIKINISGTECSINMAVPQPEAEKATNEDCELCRHENVTIVMNNEERVLLPHVFTHLFEHRNSILVTKDGCKCTFDKQVELRTMIMVYHTVAMKTGLPLFAHHIRALTRRVCLTPLPSDGKCMRFLDQAKLRMEGSVEEVPIMDLIAQNRGIDEVALGSVLEENKGSAKQTVLAGTQIHALPKEASVTDEDSGVDSETDAFGITPHPLAMQMWKDRLHELAKEGRTYTTDDRFDHIIKWRSKNWPKHMKAMEKSDEDEKDEKDDGNRRKAPKRGLQETGDNVFFQEALQRTVQNWDELDEKEAVDGGSSSSSSVLPSASSSDQPN